jgi:transcriptional regulator with XRE-family HTH domain
MTDDRLHLTDSDLLRGLMRRAPDGGSLDIRALAEAVGVSKSKIHALLSGERPSVTTDVAERICRVVDIQRHRLFPDPLPTPTGVGAINKEGTLREHERAHDAASTRGAHQLGEDPGQVEPYRRRPAR